MSVFTGFQTSLGGKEKGKAEAKAGILARPCATKDRRYSKQQIFLSEKSVLSLRLAVYFAGTGSSNCPVSPPSAVALSLERGDQ